MEFKKEHQKIANKFWKINFENRLLTIDMTYTMQNLSEDEISYLYKNALLAKKDLKIILNEIKNLNILLNINYYSQKNFVFQFHHLNL